MSGNGAGHHPADDERSGRLHAPRPELSGLAGECPDPAVLVDAAGRILDGGGAWRDLVGEDPRSLPGRPFCELVHPDDREEAAAVLAAGAPTRFDCRIEERGGGWRWFEWILRPLPEGPGVHLWGRDIHVRHTAARFDALVLEAAPDLLAVVSRDGDVLYRSRASGPSVPGGTAAVGERVFGDVHPDDLPEVIRQFERAVTETAAEQQSGEPVEVRVRGADGAWAEVEITTTNCLDVPEIAGLVVQARDISSRRRGEGELRRRAALDRRLVDAAPCGLFELDEDGRLVHVNRAWSTITGRPGEEVVGRHWSDLGDVGISAAMEAAGRGWGASGQLSTTVALVRPDGTERWVRTRLSAERAPDGSIERHVGSVEDVSSAMQDGDSSGLQMVLEATPDLVLVWDEDGRITYANGAARRTLGVSRLGFVGIDDIYSPTSRQRLEQVMPTLSSDGAWTGELAVVTADGGEIPVSQVMIRHQGPDGAAHISVVARDIAEQKRREEELAHRATHDALTGLPNRILLLERLRHALRQDGARAAVAFLDLDRFKAINDSLGHEVGDRLLVALADRLQGLLRPGDTVARFGGDEFVVLCERVDGERDAVRFAERIRQAIDQPFALPGGEVFVSASVGVASGSAVSAETLLEQADVAMYRAKDRGRARTEVFDAALRSGAAARLEIEAALRTGLERCELRVFYQPQYCLATSRLVGMEALVRWQHPTLGLMSPKEFIPIAEDKGLIVPIGAFVLEEACRQVRVWQDRFPGSAAMEIHVNLSSRQFSQPRLVEHVAAVLDDLGVNPNRLCLEITESVVMEDVESAIAILLELRALGVRVGVDDFGTGYSSLSYLKRLPVDVLKIDKSFVARLGEDVVDAAIVSSVVNLARSLGIAVVAEGVETDRQRVELRALGCPVAQGYYFSRPLSPEAAGELVAGETWR